ncbi:MAG TPA: hypothetical protein PL033_17465 [Candidatus Brocadiia bacterium]|nr:hypothetical protein [Candidatus Brocadiia bacterium]
MNALRLVFNGRWHPALPILIAGAALIVALWTYRRQRNVLGRRSLAPMAAFRALAILLLGLALLQPALTWRRIRSDRKPIAVLLDVSRSMSIADAAGRARIEAAREILVGPDGLARQLGRGRDLKLYAFSDSISSLDQTGLKDGIPADGLMTRMGDAMTDVTGREGGGGLAGIVLLTDGVSTGGRAPAEVAAQLGVPVYPVMLGARMAGRGAFFNLSLQGAPENVECIVNNTVNMSFRILRRNLQAVPEAERKTILTLEENGKQIASAPVALEADDGTQMATIPYLPTTTGLKELTARIEPLQRESVAGDNSRAFLVNVTDPRLRILMVEGTLRTEYKFLSRTLAGDPNVTLTSVVKTMKDVFYIQGAPSGVDLRRGLPVEAKAYESLDVVVLGDVMREEFDDGQLMLLKQFVEEKGGGLIMTGGNRAFSREWVESPMGNLIGFRPGEGDSRFVEESFALSLTPEGKAHPVLEGCDALFDQASEGLKLGGCNLAGEAKPGVSVLGVHPGRAGGKMPVILAHQSGKGRVLTIAANTTWKWYFHLKSEGRKSPYEKFWGQAARWAASRDTAKFGGDNLVSARTDKLEYESGAIVNITARVRTSDNIPADDATVWAEVVPPESVARKDETKGEKGENEARRKQELALQHVPLGGGEFTGSFIPEGMGRYSLVVRAHPGKAEGGRPDSEPMGTVRLDFVVGSLNREFDNVDADEDALAAVAQATGGKMFTILTAGRLPAEIESRETQTVSEKEINLHNSPAIFLLFMGCLTTEWVLRKRKQLI